jgi:hypothetical protein
MFATYMLSDPTKVKDAEGGHGGYGGGFDNDSYGDSDMEGYGDEYGGYGNEDDDPALK